MSSFILISGKRLLDTACTSQTDFISGSHFTLSRDELLTLPEFVLLSLFPNGLLPEGGHMNAFHDHEPYPVDVSMPNPAHLVTNISVLSTIDALHSLLSNNQVYLSDTYYYSQYDPTSLSYMLDFFRNVAQTIPADKATDGSPLSTSDAARSNSTIPIEPSNANAHEMLQDRAGIIVLREDLDFYAIPPHRDISHAEMLRTKRAVAKTLLDQDGIFSGLRKSEEPGTTEQHLIEMLTAG